MERMPVRPRGDRDGMFCRTCRIALNHRAIAARRPSTVKGYWC